MKAKKIFQKAVLYIKRIHRKIPLIHTIVQAIHKNNGKAFLVGGAVRDLILQLPVKDLDIEVHRLSAQKLEKILKKYGHVSLVGKAFGVYRLADLDVDWSLPRKD